MDKNQFSESYLMLIDFDTWNRFCNNKNTYGLVLK